MLHQLVGNCTWGQSASDRPGWSKPYRCNRRGSEVWSIIQIICLPPFLFFCETGAVEWRAIYCLKQVCDGDSATDSFISINFPHFVVHCLL
jgi:hypothetical protein